MINKSLLFLCALLVSFISLFSQPKLSKHTNKTYNILFVGNSLTYTNNLPDLVRKAAKAKGIKVNSKMIAFPNYAIIDHWNDGQVKKLISSKKFDFVIVQQGPSSQDEGREMLIENGKEYKNLCELNDTKLCFFMVWPSIANYQTFDNVIKNHRDAAAINNSILLPVGEIWKKHIDSTKSYEYYSSDGFHPSIKGSQITAQLIVEYLF